MSKAADIGSKRLISLAPDAWVQWVTQNAAVVVRDLLAFFASFVLDIPVVQEILR